MFLLGGRFQGRRGRAEMVQDVGELTPQPEPKPAGDESKNLPPSVILLDSRAPPVRTQVCSILCTGLRVSRVWISSSPGRIHQEYHLNLYLVALAKPPPDSYSSGQTAVETCQAESRGAAFPALTSDPLSNVAAGSCSL